MKEIAYNGQTWTVLGILLLAIFNIVLGQDANCDFLQTVNAGVSYYVYSPGYPNFYTRPRTCRWQATCPVNTKCRLVCSDVNIPATTGCTGDRLLVSKTGDPSLTGADKYCGAGTLDITSTSNKLAVGLVAPSTATGSGRFSCTLTATSATSATTPAPGCSCGWKKTNRIVGGQQTGINEYPMMAGVYDVSLKIIACGGTIISNRHVLTAAHCVKLQSLGNIAIVYGEHNVKTNTETTSTVLKSRQFIIHPSYNTNSNDYDIAIVVTDGTIVFSDRVGPACLPFKYSTTTFVSNYVDVLGWGTTSFAGVDSDYLQKVQLQVISQTSCKNSLGTIVTDRMICTYTAGKDSCQHDSGGPLLWNNPSNGRLYLVGVIIGGYGCATTRPAMNTRITALLSWITTNTPGVNYCSV